MAVFGDFILIKMRIKDKEGNVLEEGRDKGDVYVYGLNRILPKVDLAIAQMKEGEERVLTLEPQDAYGMPNPELIKTYPAAQFKQVPKVGDVLESQTPQGPIRGVVKRVENGRITIDFNPQYAGKTLVFEVKVLGIAKDEAEKIKYTLMQYDAEDKVDADTKAKKFVIKDAELYGKVGPTLAFLFPEYSLELKEGEGQKKEA